MKLEILELTGKITDKEEIQGWLDAHESCSIESIRVNNNFIYIFYTEE
jgi:hypothetical protein